MAACVCVGLQFAVMAAAVLPPAAPEPTLGGGGCWHCNPINGWRGDGGGADHNDAGGGAAATMLRAVARAAHVSHTTHQSRRHHMSIRADATRVPVARATAAGGRPQQCINVCA